MKGAKCFRTPTGPAPGPPPPWGCEKVLCRLIWITSTPQSPGRVIPMIALRLAPSQYTCPPLSWTTSTISAMCSSNSPSVLGLVIMMAATWSSMTSATAFGSTTPWGPDLIETTWYPHRAELAGLVPWADSGMRIFRRGFPFD